MAGTGRCVRSMLTTVTTSTVTTQMVIKCASATPCNGLLDTISMRTDSSPTLTTQTTPISPSNMMLAAGESQWWMAPGQILGATMLPVESSQMPNLTSSMSLLTVTTVKAIGYP